MQNLKQLWNWLKEVEDYPQVEEEFSVQKLREFDTIESIRSYLTSLFGEPDLHGIAREVWLIDNDTIIKLLRHPTSKQNMIEVKNAKCLGEKYAPKILDHHPDFLWIIQERLFQIDKQDLSDKLLDNLGYRFLDWYQMRNFFYYSTLRVRLREELDDSWGFEVFQKQQQIEWAKKLFDKLYNRNSWFTDLVNSLVSCNVESNDFHDENWGIRPQTGELVILDLGS